MRQLACPNFNFEMMGQFTLDKCSVAILRNHTVLFINYRKDEVNIYDLLPPRDEDKSSPKREIP